MAPVSLRKVEDAIKQGCQKAASSYEKITGGHWLSRAPESYIQACLFQEIGALDNLYVTIEASHKRVSEDTEMEFTEQFINDMKRGRLDMIVWWANGVPRAIIEIKKFYLMSQFDRDADRIKYWIENSNTRIQAGFLVGYTTAKGSRSERTLTDRFEKLARHVGGKLKWHDIRSDPDDYGWRSGIGLVQI